jgi:hypothetical protein
MKMKRKLVVVTFVLIVKNKLYYRTGLFLQ